MLWRSRRGIVGTTSLHRAILSAALPAGACWPTAGQSLAVFTTLPMWLKFAGITHTLDGHFARQPRFSRNLVIVMVPPGPSTSRGISRARRARWLSLEHCINEPSWLFARPETRGV